MPPWYFGFWFYITAQVKRDQIRGVSPDDPRVLLMLGYKVETVKQVMCRPSDTVDAPLPEGFVCRSFDPQKELSEVGAMMLDSYKGRVCDEINGIIVFKDGNISGIGSFSEPMNENVYFQTLYKASVSNNLLVYINPPRMSYEWLR